jgi:hypothetical protein
VNDGGTPKPSLREGFEPGAAGESYVAFAMAVMATAISPTKTNCPMAIKMRFVNLFMKLS